LRLRRARTARRRAIVAAALSASLVVACDLVGPTTPAPSNHRSPAESGHRDQYPGDAPPVITPTLSPIDIWNGKQVSAPNTVLGTYPRSTIVRVTATGILTRTSVYPAYTQDTIERRGPSGNASIAWFSSGGISTTLTITQGGFVDESATVYALIQGDVYYAGRWGYAMASLSGYRPPGMPPLWCGPAYGNPCHTYSGLRLPRFDGRVRDRNYAAACNCSS
jgi:hypothetical protein